MIRSILGPINPSRAGTQFAVNRVPQNRHVPLTQARKGPPLNPPISRYYLDIHNSLKLKLKVSTKLQYFLFSPLLPTQVADANINRGWVGK